MSTALDDFRHRYAMRPPDPRRIKDASETVRIHASDGLRLLQSAPATDVLYGMPPYSFREETNNYLWVIDTSGLPYIREKPIPTLGGAKPKHTNLTGGSEAYLGGELWFASEASIYISGGSGRYPPVDEAQLEGAVSVFESFGYEVKSLGWDYDTGGPAYTLTLEVTL